MYIVIRTRFWVDPVLYSKPKKVFVLHKTDFRCIVIFQDKSLNRAFSIHINFIESDKIYCVHDFVPKANLRQSSLQPVHYQIWIINRKPRRKVFSSILAQIDPKLNQMFFSSITLLLHRLSCAYIDVRKSVSAVFVYPQLVFSTSYIKSMSFNVMSYKTT